MDLNAKEKKFLAWMDLNAKKKKKMVQIDFKNMKLMFQKPCLSLVSYQEFH